MLVEYLGSRRQDIYAIVETGGKQYRVSPGQTIDVGRLNVAPGDKVDLEKVLLIADGDRVTVGKPVVSGAKVVATVEREVKGKKVIVFRYKRKERYDKKTGHRQQYSRLTIDQIVGPEGGKEAPAKRSRRTKKEVTGSGT